MKRQRLLIFIVAYNAERTIEDVLRRIPAELSASYETQILIIDDSSQDQTFERGHDVKSGGDYPFTLSVLFNPVNQGYGGNQKIGFHFAIENDFDFIALIHGDGQYAPECLPDLVEPLASGEADAVFGSRMLTRGGALGGGMPFYKFVGNKILTLFQNWVMRASLSEFHSGYRIYSVPALKKVPFHLNTNVFHFDTEIIYQFMLADLRIKELPIPTYYGDEICHVDGIKYAWDVVRATLSARAQEMSIFYDRRFDVRPGPARRLDDRAKLTFDSVQSRILTYIPPGTRVLNLNSAMTYLSDALRAKGCTVDDVIAEFNTDISVPEDISAYNFVLLLDVIGLQQAPEVLMDRLRKASALTVTTTFIVSTGNIGFFVPRVMHLLGQFNYSKRGTLDLYVKRLFNFGSLRRLLEQSGFVIDDMFGVPAPYPLAIGENAWSRILVAVNSVLVRVWKSLFAYQVCFLARPTPSLEFLLKDAFEKSAVRAMTARAEEGALDAKSA